MPNEDIVKELFNASFGIDKTRNFCLCFTQRAQLQLANETPTPTVQQATPTT